jgi:sec-independent protein translocase protein TatA
MNTLAFGMPGHMELIVIALVALLIFGRRLPGIAKGMGQSIIEFKKGIKGIESVGTEIEDDLKQVTHEIKEEVK